MQDAIAAVREFNRFYTRLIGALDARFLGSDLSLPEARLLFEIAQAQTPPLALALQMALGMDAGFVSRVLARFEARGWIARGRGQDARRRPISLTPEGRAAFARIDQRQREVVESLLAGLEPIQRADLVASLGAIRALLDPAARSRFSIRLFRPGDMGMIAARQSIFYSEVYGWGRGLEVLEGEVTTAFLRDFKPGREQCWVAEVNGAMAGSVMLTDEGEGLARLRLLYVEPMARGLGVGAALVGACVDFARQAGYQAITLWTHTVLESARRLYAAQGFRLIDAATHEEFGAPVQGETWRLDLRESLSGSEGAV